MKFFALAFTFSLFSTVSTVSQAAPTKSFIDANSVYGIYVLRENTEAISPKDKLPQVAEKTKVSDQTQEVVVNTVTQSLLGLAQSYSSGLDSSRSLDIQGEALRAVNLFIHQLKIQLKKLNVSRPTNFQILIAPRLSDELLRRRVSPRGDVSAPAVSTYYPSDRTQLIEIRPEAGEGYPAATDVMNSEVALGMAKVLEASYENQPKQPFVVSTTISLQIMPNVNESQVSVQTIVGMPVNGSMPFTQENDQIKFHTVEFPKFAVNQSFGLSAQNYPAAFVTINQNLNSSTTFMNVQFGPIGTFRDGKWHRVPGTDFRELVPRLRGTPKAKGAAGRAAGAAEVDFSIFNIDSNLTTQSLQNIDLYISAGPKIFPGLKLGMINRADIDSQFEAEINKTIRVAIAKEKKKLEEAQVQLQDSKIQQQLAQDLIKTLFTKNK